MSARELGNPLGNALAIHKNTFGKSALVIMQGTSGDISIPSVYSKIRLTLVGGGGKGGSGTSGSTSYPCAGAGGGSGGVAQSDILSVTARNISLSISETTSSVSYANLSMSVTSGSNGADGVAGAANTVGAVGGAGGVASGGSINISGTKGGDGIRTSATSIGVSGGNGADIYSLLNKTNGIQANGVSMFSAGVGGLGAVNGSKQGIAGGFGSGGSGGGGGGSGSNYGGGGSSSLGGAGGAASGSWLMIELW